MQNVSAIDYLLGLKKYILSLHLSTESSLNFYLFVTDEVIRHNSSRKVYDSIPVL